MNNLRRKTGHLLLLEEFPNLPYQTTDGQATDLVIRVPVTPELRIRSHQLIEDVVANLEWQLQSIECVARDDFSCHGPWKFLQTSPCGTLTRVARRAQGSTETFLESMDRGVVVKQGIDLLLPAC